MCSKATDADAGAVMEESQYERGGLDPDAPLVPGWGEFLDARSRFLGGLVIDGQDLGKGRGSEVGQAHA